MKGMKDLSERMGRLEQSSAEGRAASSVASPPGQTATPVVQRPWLMGVTTQAGPPPHSTMVPALTLPSSGAARGVPDAASLSYSQSLAQAQALIGGMQPPGELRGPERASQGRERGAEQQVREQMQKEAMQDPALAVQLGILEALEKLHGGKKTQGSANTLEELLYGAGGTSTGHGMAEDDFTKLLSGAKGSAALLRLTHAIEQEPQLWVDHFNQTIWRALGSDVSGLPWS
eukprot:4822736-Amphidinium_carterae.1